MPFRPFLKMHGLGNDFLLLDARTAPVRLSAAQVRALADRRTGIGFDQLIVLEPSDIATVRVRFWNSDGGEVGACGNGSRAVAAHLGGQISMETSGGLLTASATDAHAEVDMGAPRFGWAECLWPMPWTLHTCRWRGMISPIRQR